jgi:hypothetical protein
LCLYVGTPWEEDVNADRRDVDDFKEASCMIGRVLAVRIHVWVFQSQPWFQVYFQGLRLNFCLPLL